ncbi:MAG: hypothetical protein NTU64_10775 [Hyphomicrobiales bacterium]|nr:hypothetical protein [Hyphomicrobiales bacterium]
MASFVAAMASPAAANPMLPPTADYVADVEVTRATDYSVNVPARYVYSSRRIRIDFVGIVTLIDLDRKNVTTMIPRVRTYWAPVALAKPAADGRRWVGVEATTAEAVGTETLLGRPVTKYSVRGTVFDSRTPFAGFVWTTAENIVLQIDGTGQVEGVSTPVKVTPVQLTIAPADPSQLNVPPTYGRASGAPHPID